MAKLTATKADPYSAEKIMAVPRLVDIMNRLGWGNSVCILKAAEKVDRERALEWLALFDDYTAFPNAESFALIRKEIRALIESLPEEGMAESKK